MISLSVTEPSQAGAARRRAVQEGQALGLPEEACDRLALVVTEIATNLVRHARDGEILLVPSAGDATPAFTVVGVDLGAGIADPQAALEDGFTTAGAGARGIGGGLGAVRRLSERFDLHSDSAGTTIASTVAATRTGCRSWGGVGGLIVPKPGFEEGGDICRWRRAGDGVLVMLVDVLGHGSAAAEDARLAAAAFSEGPGDTLAAAYAAVAAALTGRRGAAALLVWVPDGDGTLEAIGLGNVRGEIVAADGTRKGIPCAPGIVGANAREPRPTEHPWSTGNTLILSTDGLRSAPRNPEPPSLLARAALTIAATLYKRRSRGTDDSGVAVVRSVD